MLVKGAPGNLNQMSVSILAADAFVLQYQAMSIQFHFIKIVLDQSKYDYILSEHIRPSNSFWIAKKWP